MTRQVVLIFDIGKTNKKILLFDGDLNILHEEETIFEEKFVRFMNVPASIIVEALGKEFWPGFGFHLGRLKSGNI